MAPGDRLVLYTDGLTEARDSQRQLLGVERLEKIFHEHAHLPIDEMARALVGEVDDFREGPARDDIVLLAVGLTGPA